MSASVTIKDWLVDKVQTCASVDTVYAAEEPNISGWPAVVITSTDMDGEFSSNSENSRVWAYRLQIIFFLGQDVSPPNNKTRLQYTEDVVATCLDEVINAIDLDFDLTGVDITGYNAKFANAADCVWGYLDMEGGIARVAEVTIRIYTEKEIL